jgi:hypothetical protein
MSIREKEREWERERERGREGEREKFLLSFTINLYLIKYRRNGYID